MTKTEELLKVLDLPKEEQIDWLWARGILPLEKGTRRPLSLASLAFRLNGGSIATKKPIEWIIDALAKELAEKP